MSAGNRYDGSCAQAVPAAVEALPLHRWRPGTRALIVGSRDGVAFDDDLAAADGASYRRPLDLAWLAPLWARSGCRALALAWSCTLAYPRSVALCLELAPPALVVAANGWGEPALLERLLPVADAWLLAAGPRPGPLAQRILDAGRHVELLAGWEDPAAPLPPLDCRRAAAIHLVPHRARLAEEGALARAWAAARRAWPGPLYDAAHRRDDCTCGATLVWRAGLRARRDALGDDGRCRACGRAHPYALG